MHGQASWLCHGSFPGLARLLWLYFSPATARAEGTGGRQHGENGLSPPRRLGKETIRGCQSEQKGLGVMGIAKEKAVCLRLRGWAEGTEKTLNKEGSGYGLKRRDRSNLTKCVYNQYT